MNGPTQDKLRALLEHARRWTTYYAGCLPPLSEALPEPVGAVLARLPVLTRQDVRREQVRLRSLGGDPERWRVVRTTGTTGEPVEVVLDEAAREVEAVVLASHIDGCLGTRAWRERSLVHLTLHAGAASRSLPSPWSPQGLVIKWNLLRVWQAGDQGFLRSLARLHGQVITAMPSVAELLADRLRAANAAGQVRPLLILLSGELLEPATRSRVREAFGCPVTTLYTLAEAGVVGTECLSDGGYHVEECAALVEILDEHGDSVPPGAEGEVVLTPLANRAMPLLRYRTGDRGSLLVPACRCGRPSPRLQLTAARRPTRLLTASGATVHVVRFAKLLAALDARHLSLTQADNGMVRVAYGADRVLDQASQAVVTASIRAALGPEVEVRIEREAGGKTAAGNFSLAAANQPARTASGA